MVCVAHWKQWRVTGSSWRTVFLYHGRVKYNCLPKMYLFKLKWLGTKQSRYWQYCPSSIFPFFVYVLNTASLPSSLPAKALPFSTHYSKKIFSNIFYILHVLLQNLLMSLTLTPITLLATKNQVLKVRNTTCFQQKF